MLVNEIILYYDARSKKHQTVFVSFVELVGHRTTRNVAKRSYCVALLLLARDCRLPVFIRAPHF